MRYLILLLIVSTLLSSNDELSFEDDFLESLEEVSEIATRTKLNVDDSPSFVTVLHNEKLEKLGINTVFEALSQVPGVQLKREASGVPVVVFRGISQKGEVKLMVDGVTINNTYRGSIYHFLDFPIELVERIEVIRGSGSILYGSGAISGVINVITKSSDNDSENTLFLSGGTYDSYKGGALVSTTLGNFHLTLDAYYQDNDKTIHTTDRHLRDFSVGVNLNNENFTLIARAKRSEQGNAYGVIGVPDLDKKDFDNTNGLFFIQLSYQEAIFKDTNLEFLTGYSRYNQFVEAAHPSSSVGTIDATYNENTYNAQLDFKSKIITNNEILLGAKYETTQVDESKWEVGTIQLPPAVDKNSTRNTTSVYVNDQYSFNNDLDISAGLRYDYYSDFGDAFSPTFAMVYRLTNKVRLKALYTTAYRAPSWVELTSNPNLEAETSNSIETGLVYKPNSKNSIRFNLYKTKLDKMITKDTTTNIYIQLSNSDFLGTELEYSFLPNDEIEFNLFASYIDAKDASGDDIADVANILATSSLIYNHSSGLSFGSLLKYVSSSKRVASDTRGDMASSTIFDETISYNFKKYTARLIIKDLFNKGTYYALPTSSTNNDFYDGGRSFLLNMEMEF